MNPEQLREALAAIGWTGGVLALRLGCHRNLPLKWLDGSTALPPAVAAWLRRLAQAHQRNPPPDDWRTRASSD